MGVFQQEHLSIASKLVAHRLDCQNYLILNFLELYSRVHVLAYAYNSTFDKNSKTVSYVNASEYTYKSWCFVCSFRAGEVDWWLPCVLCVVLGREKSTGG